MVDEERTNGSSPGAPAARVLRYAAFTHDGERGNPAGVVLDAARLVASARLIVAGASVYEDFEVDATARRGCGFVRLDQLMAEHLLGAR